MQFPDDATLLARGKYSTLGKERRAQLARIQTTCSTVMGLCSQALKGAQMDPPDLEAIGKLRKCVDSLEAAAEGVSELNEEMNTLKPEAWQ